MSFGGISEGSNTTSSQRGKRRSLNTIESSVTRLLVSTKHLLESLTQWATQEVDDKFVSDAYVKLGNDFRVATKTFSTNGIDISDIGNVPQALRIILEAALSEAPSQENLDRFLPNIRNIIVTLLQNLKTKQAKAKLMSKENEPLKENENHNKPKIDIQSYPRNLSPSVITSSSPTEENETATNTLPNQVSPRRKNDALSQLQNGDALQRRASKRFSAYQYSKLVNNNHPQINADANNMRSSALEANNSFDAQHRNISNNNSDLNNVSILTESTEDPYVLLRLGSKTRKASISIPVTFASLRLLFVEKFAYSPGLGNFPEVYIQDPKSGVLYELEEHLLDEVKSGTLLCLNEQETNTKVINDLDLKMNELTKKIESMNKNIIEEMKSSVSSIELQSPILNVTPEKSESKPLPSSSNHRKDLIKVESDLKTIKQLHQTSSNNFKDIISSITKQLQKFQEVGLEVSQNSNRSYMESCHFKLSDESDSLLTKVDELQDVMEDLRKDVAQRGVRLNEKQLKLIYKDVEQAKKSLNDMTNYISNEKPVWKKIWEAELDKVCEEQQFFNLQDDLTADLEEDIKKIEETFQLIEQCSIEQLKGASSKRNKIVQNLHIPEPGESLHDLKDAVLFDIKALTPNHESRLEAIEKAEKQRERERELMNKNKFQEELGDFVDDNKLKRSGGIEQLERLRMQKDSENIKNGFGRV